MTHDAEAPDSNYSGTVIKALDILDCLANHRRPMSTQQIARQCGMSRPTTYRLLTTLMSRGLIREGANHQYALGFKLLSLGQLVLDEIDLIELARPHLHELCTRHNETANLSILDNGELLYIGKEESTSSSGIPLVQLRSTVGTRVKPHSTAMGKAMLAHLPKDEFEGILMKQHPLHAYTKHTITDLNVLQQELNKVREQGYAIDDREVDEGTRCVAAPVFDNNGRVIAAMSVAGPAYRITLEGLHQLAVDVVRVTHNLSQELGFPGITEPQTF